MYAAFFWKDTNYTDQSIVTSSSELGSLANYVTAIKALPEWGDGSLLAFVCAFDSSWAPNSGTTMASGAGPVSGFGSVDTDPPSDMQGLLFPS